MKNKEDKKIPGGMPGMPGGMPGMPGDPKAPVLPGLGEPPEVFLRYSRIRRHDGGRMHGPRGPRFGGPRGKLDKGTAARLLKEVFAPHWLILLIVFAAIVISAQANVRANMFIRTGLSRAGFIRAGQLRRPRPRRRR